MEGTLGWVLWVPHEDGAGDVALILAWQTFLRLSGGPSGRECLPACCCVLFPHPGMSLWEEGSAHRGDREVGRGRESSGAPALP